MAGPQRYGQTCPMASALDVVGSRWALLVVRELMLGPRRFSDIHTQLQTASTDMVTSRLRELEAAGVIERIEGRQYALTNAGLALAPVLKALGRWAVNNDVTIEPSSDRGASGEFNIARRLTSVMAVAGRTGTVDEDGLVVQLTVDSISAVARSVDGAWHLSEGTDEAAEATLQVSLGAALELAFGSMPFDELVASDLVSGDTAAGSPARELLSSLDRSFGRS